MESCEKDDVKTSGDEFLADEDAMLNVGACDDQRRQVAADSLTHSFLGDRYK